MQIKNKLLLLLVMLTCGISAAWAQQHVTIADATGGTVTVDNAAPAAGETVTITVTPDAGYQIAKSDIEAEAIIDPGNAQAPSLKVDGPNVGMKIELQGDDPANLKESRTYTFTMPEAPLSVLITAHFSGVIEYNITISPDIVNGTVTSNKTTASYQETVTLTVTPAPGYEVETLQVTWIEGGTLNAILPTLQGNGIYTFEMPAHNVTITATFTKKLYTIRIADGIEHGSISAPNIAYYDDPVTVTVNPDTGYELDQLYYSYDAGGGVHEPEMTIENGQFNMPNFDITIHATFKLKKYNVEVEEAIDGDHGFVQAVPSTCSMGETVTLITSADTGYAITTLQATYEEGTTEVNLPLTPAENDTYTFVMNNTMNPYMFTDPITKNAEDMAAWANNAYVSGWGYMSGFIGEKDSEQRIRRCDNAGLMIGYLNYDPDSKAFTEEYDTLTYTEQGDITTMPEVPGIGLYDGTKHGIYIGLGEVVFCDETVGYVTKQAVSEGTWTSW